MSWRDTYPEDVWDFLDGRAYTLDGVHGKFEVSKREALYPYHHTAYSLYHRPSTKGKKSATYRKIKRDLGDDWDSDLSDQIEKFCDIARKLGFEGN